MTTMVTRRNFTRTLAGAATLMTLRPVLAWAANEPKPSADAAKLYRDSFILDCNALASIGSLHGRSNQEEITRVIRESGVTVLKATLGGAMGGFEAAVMDIAAAEQLMEKRGDLFLKVRTAGDLERAKKEQKLGVIYSFESAAMLEDKVERIELFRELGVRVMQLNYNRRTPFGVGCLDGETDGVTELGRKAIAKMNEIGVALDLSHSNTKTTADGIAASTKPPLITHAGCRAVHMHPRNKEDREMKALADKGGVFGVYMLPYITASPKQPMRDDYMQHLEHALKICGEDHVGVGTDVPFFQVDESDLEEMKIATEKRKADGIAAPGEDRPVYIPDMNTPRKMELIADALLKRGHKSGVVEKVMGANFKRVFGEIWTA
ncbi:MAG TPA: membrane dipeptidase [Chthoniobacterales bacterium]|nr:membrane dipeptidase [Chthoniobacterales bacterium]